jgi:hypothetical protein
MEHVAALMFFFPNCGCLYVFLVHLANTALSRSDEGAGRISEGEFVEVLPLNTTIKTAVLISILIIATVLEITTLLMAHSRKNNTISLIFSMPRPCSFLLSLWPAQAQLN